MKRLLLAAALLLGLASAANAQGCGPKNPNCIVPTAPNGTCNNQAASTAFVCNNGGGGGSGITQLTGDVTAGPGTGSQAATLATVNSGPGTVGSSTAIPVLTTNGKGLVTAQSSAVVIAPAGTLTGSALASGVTASSLTSFGSSPTLASPVLTGTPSGPGASITINSTMCSLSGSCTIAAGSLTPGVTTISGGTANGLLYTTSGNLLGNLATIGSGVLVTSGAGVPSISSTLPSGLSADTFTVTTSFSAAGLVSNADLANPATTVNGQTCTLGSTCTVAAAAGTLTGTTLNATVVTSSLTTVGTIGTGVWQGTAIALAYGGTNNALTASAGGLVWSDATKLNILAGTVTAGQCLLSGSSATPTWGSCSGAAAVSSVTNADGTLTVTPTTGAVVASLALGHANTWTGAQTFTNGDLLLKGSSSGAMTLEAPAVASTFVMTFPATTDTVAVLGTAQTFTAAQTFTNSDILLLGSSTGATTFTSANASATNYTLTFPAATSTVAVLGAVNQTFTQTETFSGTLNVTGALQLGGNVIASVFRNYIGGLVLSNDGSTPNSVLDTAAGAAADSTNAVNIVIGAFTKSTAGAWAANSGSNGMGNGLTVAASTWYHVCLANNGGTPDEWFDTSATCANRPAGISDTKYRRIGSFRTDASAHILTFTQNFSYFYWATPPVDLNTGTASTSDVTLTVPLGVVVTPLLDSEITLEAAATPLNGSIFYSKAGGSTYAILAAAGLVAASTDMQSASGAVLGPLTNTSSQIRVAISLTGTPGTNNFSVTTIGYIDMRGQ